LAWFILAYKLGVPVRRLQRETSSTDFIRWVEFLRLEKEREENERYVTTADQHYLAQIAMEICKGNVKHPSRLKIRDFLLKFMKKKSGEKISTEEKADQTKNYFMNVLGVKKNG